MANPSVRRSINRDPGSGQERSQPLPLVTRRFAAWAVEVSLIVASGLVPFGMGMYAKSYTSVDQVPLNPVLVVTEEAVARTLNIPIDNSNRNVAPLTNLFWSAALVAPLVLSGWQLYLLARTGTTLPKRRLGVRVVTAAGTTPGISRILVREVVGCWGLPLSIAYLLWRFSGGSDLSILAGLSCLMVLGEGMSARFHRQRRCLHDLLAGTYVMDANRSFVPLRGNLNAGRVQQPAQQRDSYRWQKVNANAALTGTSRRRGLWRWMRQNPSLTLLVVALSSMAAVLGTLVSTQVYIQTQANQRQEKQQNSEQFLALVRQLNLKPFTTTKERQRAILGLGTLNDPQALQLLVNLLGQETDPIILDAVQQALGSTGPRALPYLRRLNQLFSNQMESLRYTEGSAELALHASRLQATQQAISRILVIYSGKVHAVDLSRTNLGQVTDAATPVLESHSHTIQVVETPERNATWSKPFSLMLDKIDLSGIHLRAANLNQTSFQGSLFRGPGEDGRWDTFDDWIADLSDSQMREANLTGANLSRVLMNRINLLRATLNQANLSGASLSGANLSSTQLVEANLRNAVLDSASLTGANLGEAVLTQANLYAARLGRVSALATHLQSANLAKSDWQGADLSGADLSSADLRNADLSATRLIGANFRDAQLQNVSLHNADLNLADLRGANLAGADLQGAIFISSKSAKADQFIQSPSSDLQSALVEGVDFTKAKNLAPNQLAYICTQGGHHPRCP